MGVHSHLNDAKSHRENFLQHHDRLRLKHHKLLQSRSEKKAMAKSFKALRATDANHELMHVGRCTIQNCTFALGKHTFHLERHAVVEAFSGLYWSSNGPFLERSFLPLYRTRG